MTDRILLVEDVPNELLMLAQALERTGLQATVCNAAEGAAHVIKDQRFVACVVSCSPSGHWGIAFLQGLRRDPAGKRMPVLGLVDDPEVRARTLAFEAGATELLHSDSGLELVRDRVMALASRGVVLPGEHQVGLPHQILLVDDSATYSSALIAELNKDGFDVMRADSGAEALRFLGTHGVGVLVLDVFLPDMSGIEVCKRVRAMAMHRDTPVFMLTGRKASVLQASAVEAGADDFAVKSRDLDSVRERVRAMCAHALAAKRESSVMPTRRIGLGRSDDPSSLPAGASLVMPAAAPINARPLSASMPVPRAPRSSGAMAAAAAAGARPSRPKAPEVRGILTGPTSPLTLSASSAAAWVATASAVAAATATAATATAAANATAATKAAKAVKSTVPTANESTVPADIAAAEFETSAMPPFVRRTETSTTIEQATRVGGKEEPREEREPPISRVEPSALKLLDRLVIASGLSEILGRRVIADSCIRAGIHPETMSTAELRRAMPNIERVLHLFLTAEELATRMPQIEALLAQEDPSKASHRYSR